MSTLHFFTLDQKAEEKLVPHSRLLLPHCPLDVTFDPEGRLWALMDSRDSPLQIYSHRGDCWEVERTRLHTDTYKREDLIYRFIIYMFILKPTESESSLYYNIHSRVCERNVFNFLFKINQMTVDDLLHL